MAGTVDFFTGEKLNSSVISESHRRAGILLKSMMEHNQISVNAGADIFGISRIALIAYRSGANGISYKNMNKMIEVMNPSDSLKANFISAVQLSAIESWRKYGESKKAKQRRGEI